MEREEIGKIFAVVGICQAVISLAGYRYFIIGELPSCHLSCRIQVLYYWGTAELSSLWQDTCALNSLVGYSCQLSGRIHVLYYWQYTELSSLWQDTGTLLLWKRQAVISLAGYRYFIIGDLPRCHLSGRIQVLYYWGTA